MLEQHGTRLAGCSSLSDLIPFVHQREIENISNEIEGNNVSVIFDGTTRMGQAMAIIVRFASDD